MNWKKDRFTINLNMTRLAYLCEKNTLQPFLRMNFKKNLII
ncbi:hypothetical protein NMS_1407 [Nonlabens marinus S1-08]|uniref:Uncharacterized protein n=1 Tax=Nonlabens marinus S1-08 TaxID=1454201 RepID=W8VZZ1_9FLAO|nr:hypothetical protein NMS_1407 [Nonlabens marinus S1-08]